MIVFCDSISNYHNSEIIGNKIKDYLLHLFDLVIRFREENHINKKKKKSSNSYRQVPDELIKERIKKMPIRRLQCHDQHNGFDCGIYAQGNQDEFVYRLVEWLESRDNNIRYSSFLNYWNIGFSVTPQQAEALRKFYHAMVLKFSESYFYYANLDNRLSTLVKSPGITELRAINKQKVLQEAEELTAMSDLFFNLNNAPGTDRDSESANHLILPIHIRWSNNINFGLINGKFRLFKNFNADGLANAIGKIANPFIKASSKKWIEMPHLKEDYKDIFWYCIWAALEIGDRVWFSKCPSINKYSGEIMYITLLGSTMCDEPNNVAFALSPSMVDLIELDETSMKAFDCKPSIAFDNTEFEEKSDMFLKAKDMLYDLKKNRNKNRKANQRFVTKLEEILPTNRIDHDCPFDVYQVIALWDIDHQLREAYLDWMNSTSGRVYLPETIGDNNVELKRSTRNVIKEESKKRLLDETKEEVISPVDVSEQVISNNTILS